MKLIHRVYVALLHLYPREFRDEFGDEMEAVFADMLAENAKRGNIELILTCLREFRDLPIAILREHWATGRKSVMGDNPHVSRLELLITAIPFLLYLAFPVMEGLRFNGGALVILHLLGALFILPVVGAANGMPRWSLPALGLLLVVLNYIQFSMLGIFFVLVTATPPLFLREIFGSGFSYIGIIVLTTLIILVTSSVKRLHPFYIRIRKDWTLLPFALFGIVPVTILLSFDEYQGDVPYQIGIGLILLASVWLYLRSARPGRRLLALGIGITLTMAIQAIGKWILIPGQPWVNDIEQTIQSEVTGAVTMWVWVMVVVMFPALLGLLPQDKRAIPATL